jgi:hypothetical protein
MVFIYITYRSISRVSSGGFFALALALLTALVLFTANLFLFQSFYIHVNLPVAVYLFVAVGTCWLAISEQNNAWLAIAVSSLISFSLLRTETFVFAMFILFLVISLYKFPGRARWFFTLPFIGLMFLWYVLFYLRFIRETNILSPARILLLLVSLVCLGLYVFILRYRKLEELVQAIVVYAIAAGAVLLLAGMLLFETRITITSLVVTLQNMLVSGGWGAIWYAVFVGLILAFTQPRFKNENFFVLILAIYFVSLIALGSIRTLPYHLGRFDSGNRMLTHILPVVVYYLVLKYGPGFMERVSRFKAWLAEYKSSELRSRL